MDSVIMWATAVITIGGALGVVWKLTSPLVRKFQHLVESLNRFTVDWFGEEAREGRSRIPGVMERLNNIDGELKHNGGSSMKDAVAEIKRDLKLIDKRLEEGNQRFDRIEKRMNNE